MALAVGLLLLASGLSTFARALGAFTAVSQRASRGANVSIRSSVASSLYISEIKTDRRILHRTHGRIYKCITQEQRIINTVSLVLFPLPDIVLYLAVGKD